MTKSAPSEYSTLGGATRPRTELRHQPRPAPEPPTPATATATASWPFLLMFIVTAGVLAAAVAYAFGGLGAALAGRRTYLTVALQILGIVVVAGTAGMVVDRVFNAVRRDTGTVRRRV